VTDTLTTNSQTTETRRAVIDCDIHNVVPNVFALFPYLPEHWREHINQSLFKGANDTIYPPNAPNPGSIRTSILERVRHCHPRSAAISSGRLRRVRA
jgi:hypothetical protein